MSCLRAEAAGLVHVVEAVHRAAGLAEAKSRDGPDGGERTRRGGGDGLRSSGFDRGPGDGPPPGGLGADHRPDLLAAQLRLADLQPEARRCDRGVGGCLGLLRGRSQVPGDRQLPRSSPLVSIRSIPVSRAASWSTPSTAASSQTRRGCAIPGTSPAWSVECPTCGSGSSRAGSSGVCRT